MSVVYWTDEELEILRENSGLNSKEIVSLLPGRSYASIVQKRKLTGYRYTQKWDEEEINLLKNHSYLSATEIHEMVLPHRSIQAIKSMRSLLKAPHTIRCSKCGASMTKNNQYNICPECKRDFKEYNRSALGKYRAYKHGALRRGVQCELSLETFMKFWGKPCEYCGSSVEAIGIDRVDNTRGYPVDNCVPCCKLCNQMKMDLSKEDWINHMKKILGATHEAT